MRLRVSRRATLNLDEIWVYVAKNQSLEAAERLINLITRRFTMLAKSPGIGRNRPELRQRVRSFTVQKYRIYYRQERSGVVRILSVRHAARDEKRSGPL
jgi:toxin ParE1/3/4